MPTMSPEPVALIEHRHQQDLEELSRRWSLLFSECPDLTVFSSHEWYYCWWEAVGSRLPGAQLLILECRTIHSQRTVGLFPLMRWDGENGDRPAIHSLSHPFGDYFDLLVHPDYETVCLEAWGRADSTSQGNHQLPRYLSSVRADSRTFHLLERHFPPWAWHYRPTRPSPLLDLRNPVALGRALNKRTTRLKANRLSRRGELSVIHLSDSERIEGLLDLFAAHHSGRWEKHPHGIGLFTDALVKDFFSALSRTLPQRNLLLFSVLHLDATPIAFYFGFIHDKTYSYYRSAFDPAFFEFSPGLILLDALIGHCHEAGFETFDFLRGDYAFKERFCNRKRANVDITLPINHL